MSTSCSTVITTSTPFHCPLQTVCGPLNERGTDIKATADPNGYENPSAPMYITNGVGGHYDGLDVLEDTMPDYIDYAVSAPTLAYD